MYSIFYGALAYSFDEKIIHKNLVSFDFQFCELGNFSIHLALRNLRPSGKLQCLWSRLPFQETSSYSMDESRSLFAYWGIMLIRRCQV